MKLIGRAFFPVLAGACLLAAPSWAADGVLIVQKVTVGDGAAQTHQVQIEARRMRAESNGPRGGTQVMIFDGTRGVMMIVDDANKTYSEITKADVDAMGAQISSAMSQMQDALKNVPPEQRAQVEAMMRGRMGGRGGGMAAMGGAASKTVYKKTGTGTVGKWTCDKYEGTRDGQKVSELCTVDPKVLGFAATDFGVTKDMAAFFEKLMPAAASQMFSIGTAEEQGYSGVPVRSVTTVGSQTVTTEIADVKRQAFPDSIFQAPAGYTKGDSPFGAMGRGRRGGGD